MVGYALRLTHPTKLSLLRRLLRRSLQHFQHLRRRHRQRIEPLAERVVDGVGDRCHHGDQRHFADALDALWVFGVRHFDHDAVEHRQVRTDRHAVVEEAGVIDLAFLGIDVLLVQRPADALGYAALELALDIAGVDGAADVLHGGVADDTRDAEIDVDLDVADMRAETAVGARGVELHAGADGAAHRGRLLGEFFQRQRLELAGVRAHRVRRALLPLHRFGIDLPDFCRALAQRGDDLFGRLRHDNRRGEQHTAATGEVRETDRLGVADDDGDAAVIDPKKFGADVGDARAGAADVGMARGDDDVAVLGDVDLRRGFATGVEPEAGGCAPALKLAERRLVVIGVLRGFQRLDKADTRKHRAVRGFGSFLRGVLQAEVERIHLQRFGDFIHHAFDRIGADRRTRRAIGRDLRAVGDDVIAFGEQVRDVVGREAAASGAADRRARKGAGLQIEGAVRGCYPAVFRRADLHRALRA